MRRLGKLALLNDLLIYELTNATLEEYLKDQEKTKTLIKKLNSAHKFIKLGLHFTLSFLFSLAFP